MDILFTCPINQKRNYIPPSFQGKIPAISNANIRKITKDDFLEVLNSGLSVSQNCSKLNVSETKYYKLLKGFDIKTQRMKTIERNLTITKEQIQDLLNAGKKYNEILKELNITADTYNGLLLKYNIKTELMRSKEKISNITKEQIEELLQSGKKVKEICAILNIPEKTYTRLINKFGIITERKKSKIHLASITAEKLQKLVDNKLSVSEICENLKINKEAFYKLLKQLDIKYDYQHHYNEILIPERVLRTAAGLNKTTRETAEDLNIAVTTYHQKTKAAHVPTLLRNSIDNIALVSRDELQQAVNSGLTIKQICEKFKIKRTNYKALIEKYNISTPQRDAIARNAGITAEQFLTLSKSGKAVKEICNELGISESTYRRLKRKFIEQSPLNCLV